MRAPSLVRRLALLQQSLAAVLILLFAGCSIWLSSGTLERQESSFLLEAASQMGRSITHELGEEGDLRVAAQSALADAPVGVHIRVLDRAGHEVLSAPPVDRSPGKEWREARVALEGGGWLVASMPEEPRRRAVWALALALAVTAVPLFIAVTALSRTLARRALGPLSRIASQAERTTADGTGDRFTNAADPVEVATLAGAFDHLLSRLHESIRAERHFTQDAAHELRTPLTALCGEIEYAMQDPSLGLRVRDGLERARQQARAMSDLVEALLLLRRLEPGANGHEGAHQPVNLSDLVRDVVEEFRAMKQGRASDLEVTAEDEVLVSGHSTLLASAIRNLLSNAFKFTSAGQGVRVRVFSHAGQGTVVVEDGGLGVAPSDQERVFDPFFRSAEARASHDGFGLGLPILRRVARAHGGDVRLTSSPLGGARFELSLPGWSSSSNRLAPVNSRSQQSIS